MLFSPEELEEIRLADEEIEKEFENSLVEDPLTEEEREASIEMDLFAMYSNCGTGRKKKAPEPDRAKEPRRERSLREFNAGFEKFKETRAKVAKRNKSKPKSPPPEKREPSMSRKEYLRKYYRDHAEFIKAKTKSWKQANPEKVKEQLRNYREKHRDRCIEYQREWRKKKALAESD